MPRPDKEVILNKGGLTPELRPLSTIILVTVLVLLIVINNRAEKQQKE